MLQRIGSLGIAVMLGLVAAVTSGASSASAGPPANAWGRWTNFHSDLHMSIDGPGEQGDHVNQNYYGGLDDQEWQWVPSAQAGWFYLRNAYDWKVLGIEGAGKSNGAHAVLWSWNNSPDQRWRAQESGYPGHYILRNQNSDKCLGVEAASKQIFAHLVQWTCGANSDHLWFFNVTVNP